MQVRCSEGSPSPSHVSGLSSRAGAGQAPVASLSLDELPCLLRLCLLAHPSLVFSTWFPSGLMASTLPPARGSQLAAGGPPWKAFINRGTGGPVGVQVGAAPGLVPVHSLSAPQKGRTESQQDRRVPITTEGSSFCVPKPALRSHPFQVLPQSQEVRHVFGVCEVKFNAIELCQVPPGHQALCVQRVY